MEDLFSQINKGSLKELNVILKTDVTGSMEVLKDSIAKIKNDKVSVSILHAGIGGITESDVMLAVASDAVIIGFHVRPDARAEKLSEKEIVESLKEKEVLLKEIHHRVKNNLQVISSILNLQSSFVKDEKTLEILDESRNRIRSMAIIHENLYRTTNFSSIDFTSYLQNLCTNLISSYHVYSGIVEFKDEMEKIDLVLDQAIPCGLLVNELITNSIKYAFPSKQEGQITVGLEEKDETIYLRIEDNGIGLPKDFDMMKTDTLGLQLVSTLVEQLDGEITVRNHQGTKYLITFGKVKL